MSIIEWEPGERPGRSDWDPHGTVAGNRPGAGGGSTWAAPPKGKSWRQREEARLTPKQKQQILRNIGYDISVDGKWGRQSEMAWKAYQNGVHPNYWNKNARVSNSFSAKPPKSPKVDPRAPVTGTKPPPAAVKPPAQTTTTNPVKPPKKDKKKPNTVVPGLGNYGVELVDVDEYVKSGLAQYDPQTNQLERERKRVEQETQARVKALHDWYFGSGGVIEQAQGVSRNNSAMYGAAQTDMRDASQGIVEALGGTANASSGMVAAAGEANAGMIGAIGAAREGFDNAVAGTILPAAAAEDKLRAQQDGDSYVKELVAQLSDIKGQRGKSEAQLRAEANQLRLQQQAAIQSLRAQEYALMNDQSMDPLRRKALEQQLRASQWQLRDQQANSLIDQEIKRLQRDQLLSEVNAGEEPAVPPWNKLDVGQLSQLEASAQQIVQGLLSRPDNTHFKASKFLDAIGGQLLRMSNGAWNYQTDPAVRNWIVSLLQSIPGRPKWFGTAIR